MRSFWIITGIVLLNASCATEYEPTQAERLNELYPKMNSKMARMEELMNRIDRFLGMEEFKERIQDDCIEFTWLATQALGHSDEYKEEPEAIATALQEVVSLGGELHSSIESDNISDAKLVLSKLDSIRRESHSSYVH